MTAKGSMRIWDIRQSGHSMIADISLRDGMT